jgi:hypothetical protein
VLELSIDRAREPGKYEVAVVRSPVGEASASVSIDSDKLMERRDHWQEALLASSASTRRTVPRSESVIRAVGQNLFEVLFGDPVIGGRYRSSMDSAVKQGEGLRVVLRLSAPELTPLPWEAMFDPHAGTYVSRTEPLVRHVPVASAARPLRVQQPVRILGLTASPAGLPALDVEAEQRYLDRALEEPIRQGRIELAWLHNATWEDIQDRLLGAQWHVVHFIGHGDFDAQTDEGVLALVGADGRAHRVEAGRFADLLHEASPMPRLVVLNSCLSAVSGSVDLFSGTAAALVRGGVSAVVAMQFEITDLAAAAFSRGFYTAIAAGRPVDQAVRSGRVAILGMNGHTLEWITPVLYVRGQTTRLFNIKNVPEADGEVGGSAESIPVVEQLDGGVAVAATTGNEDIAMSMTSREGTSQSAVQPEEVAPLRLTPTEGRPQAAADPNNISSAPTVKDLPPHRDPRQKLSASKWWMLLLLLPVIALGWVFFLRNVPVQVDSDRYVGRPLGQVHMELFQSGLNVQVRRQQAEGVSNGTVLSVEPTGEVTRNSAVTVVVAENTSPEPAPSSMPFHVPNVVGLSTQEASKRVKESGLKPIVLREENAQGPPDIVLRTSPEAGRMLTAGDTVAIVVAERSS